MTSPADTVGASRIYVDLDDVLAETGRAFLKVLETEFGRKVPFEEIVDYDLGKSLGLEPSALAAFMRSVHRTEVLAQLPAIRGAVAAVNDWTRRGYEVEVVTGRPKITEEVSRQWLESKGVAHHKLTFVDKYTWTEQVFTGSPVVPLQELATEGYCLAVEDSADVAVRLVGLIEAPVALLDRPWNRGGVLGSRGDGRIVRCRDWSEIRERFPAP